LFFNWDIEVEDVSEKSSQAKVFFGREKNMKIRVVVKQYRGKMLNAIKIEMKIFTLLDAQRSLHQGSMLTNNVEGNLTLQGLPQLLGYKVN
jgi:hypothetical protein